MKLNTANAFIMGVALFSALCVTVFFWSMYYPYHKTREENYRKELKVLQDLCASGLIPGEYQINSVTYGGKATNCSQAFVFTQIPIVFGALSDMWDDSLPRFILYGGNWQIQLIISICVIIFGVQVTRMFTTWLVSAQLIDQLNPGKKIAKMIHGPTPNASSTSSALIIPRKPLSVNSNYEESAGLY